MKKHFVDDGMPNPAETPVDPASPVAPSEGSADGDVGNGEPPKP